MPPKWSAAKRDLGTIEAGKLADLVVLDAEPLTNISKLKPVARSTKVEKAFDDE